MIKYKYITKFFNFLIFLQISDYKQLRLVSVYLKISELYKNDLKFHCSRFLNNNKPKFTDVEVITIYLFVMKEQKYFEIKQIYDFTKDYMSSWFPDMPSYVAFNTRLNNLSSVFERLSQIIIASNMPKNCDFNNSLLDSMPIITCSGKRKAKVALEITDKSYNSTKNLWYHGVKLHALGFRRPNTIPYPESIIITQASENDLNVFKQYWSNFKNRTFWGDKIYTDNNFFPELVKKNNSVMYTPVKETKGKTKCLKKRDRAFNDLFSSAVSKIREPIESFFSWLIQKTEIQRAFRVRSTKGLIVHILGRLTAAFI